MSDANGARTEDSADGPRVLHVADHGVFVRFGRMLRQLLLGLADADVRPEVLTDDAASAERFVPPLTTAHVVHSLNGWRSWRLAARLSERLGTLPTLAHVWGMRPVAAVGRWTQRHGIPMLIHALSTDDVLRLNRRGARPDQYVAGACDSLCRALGVRQPVSHYPVQRLTPGILTPSGDPPARRETRTIGVAWIGAITRASGLETLIDALALVQKGAREVQLAIIGRGPQEGRLRSRIRERGLQDCVSIIDEAGRWDDILPGVDVCVVPARQHELSLSPLMAMALAKTVIASRDQIAEWFAEDRTVWMFNPGSSTDLAACLARADSHREEAAALGARARLWVREQYKVSRLVEDTARFYASVAYPRQTVAFGTPGGHR